jgi:hypothetical protein
MGLRPIGVSLDTFHSGQRPVKLPSATGPHCSARSSPVASKFFIEHCHGARPKGDAGSCGRTSLHPNYRFPYPKTTQTPFPANVGGQHRIPPQGSSATPAPINRVPLTLATGGCDPSLRSIAPSLRVSPRYATEPLGDHRATPSWSPGYPSGATAQPLGEPARAPAWRQPDPSTVRRLPLGVKGLSMRGRRRSPGRKASGPLG